ncbi:RNA polymerase sigma factor [Planctomycetota bacterium]
MDQELVDAACNGDRDSFAQLYRRYHGAMLALAYSVLGDRTMAEDVAQEAFAVACRDLGKLRNNARFGVWLGSICRHTAKRMLHKRNRQTSFTTKPIAEKHDQSDDRFQKVNEAVRELPRKYRDVIVLRYYETSTHNTFRCCRPTGWRIVGFVFL